MLAGLGQEEKPPRRRKRGFLLLLSPHRSGTGGLREGQTGTIFFHMWERVLWRVLCLTLGEVVFSAKPPVPDPSALSAGTALLAGPGPRSGSPP